MLQDFILLCLIYSCFSSQYNFFFHVDLVLQTSDSGVLHDGGLAGFDGTEINIGGHFSLTTNTLTIPETGLYLMRLVSLITI